MKSNEVRLGNLYFYQIYDQMEEIERWLEPSKIDQIDIDILDRMPDDPDFQPIPLSKDILQSVGFVWSELHSGMVLGHFLIKKKKNRWHVYHHLNKLSVIDSVHELQNLWHGIHLSELDLSQAHCIQPKPLKKTRK